MERLPSWTCRNEYSRYVPADQRKFVRLTLGKKTDEADTLEGSGIGGASLHRRRSNVQDCNRIS